MLSIRFWKVEKLPAESEVQKEGQRDVKIMMRHQEITAEAQRVT